MRKTATFVLLITVSPPLKHSVCVGRMNKWLQFSKGLCCVAWQTEVEMNAFSRKAVPCFSVRQPTAPAEAGPRPEHGPTGLPRVLQAFSAALSISETINK